MKSGLGKQIYTQFLPWTSEVVPFTASIKNNGNNITVPKIMSWKTKDNTGKETYKFQKYHGSVPDFESQ